MKIHLIFTQAEYDRILEEAIHEGVHSMSGLHDYIQDNISEHLWNLTGYDDVDIEISIEG